MDIFYDPYLFVYMWWSVKYLKIIITHKQMLYSSTKTQKRREKEHNNEKLFCESNLKIPIRDGIVEIF